MGKTLSLDHKVKGMSRNLKAITMYEWANEMNCAVTVCDTEGVILYMNE